MKIAENSLAIYRAVAILFQFKAHKTHLGADLYRLFFFFTKSKSSPESQSEVSPHSGHL